MMPIDDPNQRILLTERSLRKFTMDLLGFIPVFGLPLAGLAVWTGWRVRKNEAGKWNPGARDAMLAFCFGLISIALQLGTLVALVGFSPSSMSGSASGTRSIPTLIDREQRSATRTRLSDRLRVLLVSPKRSCPLRLHSLWNS